MGRLRTVRLGATSLLSRIGRTSGRQWTVVDALSNAVIPVVIGIEDVQPARFRGSHGGRVGKGPEARSGSLSAVGALAAGDHGRVGGTSSGQKGQRTLILAGGGRPGRSVIGVPEVVSAGVGGSHRGRAGERGETRSGHLTAVGALAA